MDLFGLKITNDLLLAFPGLLKFFLIALFILFLLGVIKVTFGKEIILVLSWFKTFHKNFKEKGKNHTHDDWIAICKRRTGWIQKSTAEYIDLKGNYLKQLSFTVTPITKSKNWRGGFILGNEKFKPEQLIDSKNSITIHTGAPPPIKEAQHIWYYDKHFTRNNPGSTSVKVVNNQVHFNINIDNNKLSVRANNQPIYSEKINPNFRKKVYLLAWGDHDDCKVKFTNISYTS